MTSSTKASFVVCVVVLVGGNRRRRQWQVVPYNRAITKRQRPMLVVQPGYLVLVRGFQCRCVSCRRRWIFRRGFEACVGCVVRYQLCRRHMSLLAPTLRLASIATVQGTQSKQPVASLSNVANVVFVVLARLYVSSFSIKTSSACRCGLQPH